MSKQIYIVFSCNEWKNKDSMRLLTATSSLRKLKSFIARKITEGDFDYNGLEEDQRKLGVQQFKRDFDLSQMPVSGLQVADLNGHLDFGYIEIVDDGEEM